MALLHCIIQPFVQQTGIALPHNLHAHISKFVCQGCKILLKCCMSNLSKIKLLILNTSIQNFNLKVISKAHYLYLKCHRHRQMPKNNKVFVHKHIFCVCPTITAIQAATTTTIKIT